MALQTTRIDDLTGEPDATEVVITVNGEGVAIDLAGKSVAALTKALAPYFGAGTASKYDVERKGFSKRKVAGAPNPADVRAWADANGVAIARNGRIPREIVDQYLRAT